MYNSAESDYYVIDINLDDGETPIDSMLDDIRSLSSSKKSMASYEEVNSVEERSEEPFVMSKQKKEKKKKKDKKKGKRSIIDEGEGFDIIDTEEEYVDDDDEELLLDIDNIIREREDTEIDDDIINEQKHGYKKLKKQDNQYKKEFAEELTLLYNLLDETGKFGKELEKELKSIKSSRSRGVSKYTNDLAELILSSKQNKLNILKEISAIKKTIADLKIKSDSKDKNDKNDGNSAEKLAAAYFKNILSNGRRGFIDNYIGDEDNGDNVEYDNMIDKIEFMKNSGTFAPDEEMYETYNKQLDDRLLEGNPFRSAEGSKYIEYENAGVKIYVKKCIDTGEWEFIALDKHKQQIFDYPIPSKRGAGRMRFSEDGSYVTDEKGIMYNVIEYYLPNEE